MAQSIRQSDMPDFELKSMFSIDLSDIYLAGLIDMLHLMPDSIIGKHLTQAHIDRDIESFLRGCSYKEQSVCVLLNVYTRALPFLRTFSQQMFIRHMILFRKIFDIYQQPNNFINEFIKFQRKISEICDQPMIHLPTQVIRYRNSIQFTNFSKITEQLIQNSQLYDFDSLENQFLQTIQNKIVHFYNNFEGQPYSLEVEYFKNIIAKINHCFLYNKNSRFLRHLFNYLLQKLPFVYTIINLLKKYGCYHHIERLLEIFIRENATHEAINISHYYLTFFSSSLNHVKIEKFIDNYYHFGKQWADQLVTSIKPGQVLHPNYMNDEPFMFLIFNKLLCLHNFKNQDHFINIIMQHQYEPYAKKFSKNHLIRESIIALFLKNVNEADIILNGILQEQSINF